MASGHFPSDSSDFLKKFERLLNNPDIETLQWSDDGKYAVFDWKLYEHCRSAKTLSPFKMVKDKKSLKKLMNSYGFQRIMGKGCDYDNLLFEHPDIRRGEDQIWLQSSYQDYPRTTSPPWKNDVLLDMCFSPIRRKNARSLYPYINDTTPPPKPGEMLDHPQPSPDSRPQTPQCCSLSLPIDPISLPEAQIQKELASSLSKTTNDPETASPGESLS